MPGNMIDSACQWVDTDADDVGDTCRRIDLGADCTAVEITEALCSTQYARRC
jgi:hypothetical protein